MIMKCNSGLSKLFILALILLNLFSIRNVLARSNSVGFCATPPLGYIIKNRISATSHGVFSKDLRWRNGKRIKVAFDFQRQDFRYTPICQSARNRTDCEYRIKKKVANVANTWSRYGNIHFQFGVPWNQGEIRIRFRKVGGGSSNVGIYARSTSKHKETMMLGIDGGFESTILHEFGHAIGFWHEHQSPKIRYTWNEEQVIQDQLLQNPLWDRETVIKNVFTPLNKSSERRVGRARAKPTYLLLSESEFSEFNY